MTMDQKQQTALFRYGVIAPLITGNKDPGMSNRAFFHQAAQKSYPGADGTPKTVSAATIEKWYGSYKKGALMHWCLPDAAMQVQAENWMMTCSSGYDTLKKNIHV